MLSYVCYLISVTVFFFSALLLYLNPMQSYKYRFIFIFSISSLSGISASLPLFSIPLLPCLHYSTTVILSHLVLFSVILSVRCYMSAVYTCQTSNRVHCHSVLSSLQTNNFFQNCVCHSTDLDSKECDNIQKKIFLHSCVTHEGLSLNDAIHCTLHSCIYCSSDWPSNTLQEADLHVNFYDNISNLIISFNYFLNCQYPMDLFNASQFYSCYYFLP